MRDAESESEMNLRLTWWARRQTDKKAILCLDYIIVPKACNISTESKVMSVGDEELNSNRETQNFNKIQKTMIVTTFLSWKNPFCATFATYNNIYT